MVNIIDEKPEITLVIFFRAIHLRISLGHPISFRILSTSRHGSIPPLLPTPGIQQVLVPIWDFSRHWA